MAIFTLQSLNAEINTLRAGELELDTGSVITPVIAVPTRQGQVLHVVPSIFADTCPGTPIIVYYTDILIGCGVDGVVAHGGPRPLHAFCGLSGQALRPVILALCPPEFLVDYNLKFSGDSWTLFLGPHGRVTVTAAEYAAAAAALAPDATIAPSPILPAPASLVGKRRGQQLHRSDGPAAAAASAALWLSAVRAAVPLGCVLPSLPASPYHQAFVDAIGYKSLVSGAGVVICGDLAPLGAVAAQPLRPDPSAPPCPSALTTLLTTVRALPPTVCRFALTSSPCLALPPALWSAGFDVVCTPAHETAAENAQMPIGTLTPAAAAAPAVAAAAGVTAQLLAPVQPAQAGAARAPSGVERAVQRLPFHVMDVRDADGAADLRGCDVLSPGCRCPACTRPHSVAYLRHLCERGELTGEVLLAAHTLGWFSNMGRELRKESLYTAREK